MALYFRVGDTIIDPYYVGNGFQLQNIENFLQDINNDNNQELVGVYFYGAASPEGGDNLNRSLANNRANHLREFVLSVADIPNSIIHYNVDNYIPWDYLKELVSDSNLQNKEAILSIFEGGGNANHHENQPWVDSRIERLKLLDNGKAWRQLSVRYFGRMRRARVIFVTRTRPSEPKAEPEPKSEPKSESEPEPKSEQITEVTESTQEPVADNQLLVTESLTSTASQSELGRFVPGMHIKTNSVGAALAIANLSLEFDFAKRWSLDIPVFYSAWNYFKPTIKFRTLALQPELRFWFKEGHSKFYIGAHGGAAYYNLAFDGAYRYQDMNGEKPALGGGIGFGYRLPISKNGRWSVDFGLGAGIYKAPYDKFYNTTNVLFGELVESKETLYLTIDNVAISFGYKIGFKKRGGKR